MRARHLLIVAVAMVVGSATATAATIVRDETRGFSFALPDGYVENPGGTRTPKLSLAFIRNDPVRPDETVLQVISLGATIGRGKLDPAIVERSAREAVRGSGVELGKFEYRTSTWKGFEVEVVVTHAKREGRSFFTLSAQVPLAKEAIQLVLAGPAENEPMLLADFAAVLASVDGKSNWLTDEERSERLGRSIGIVVGVVGVVAVITVLRFRKRRRAQGA